MATVDPTAGGGHGTGSKHPVNVGDHLKTIGTDRRDGTYVKLQKIYIKSIKLTFSSYLSSVSVYNIKLNIVLPMQTCIITLLNGCI